jgi:lysophospholipase
MAFSGGGYRASFFTAGVLTAFDARNETSRSKGTGGLLQVTQYMSGLSGSQLCTYHVRRGVPANNTQGGSWLISSLVYNAFPQIRELVLGNTDLGGNLSGWLLDLNVIAPNGIDIFGSWNRAYYESILKDVRGKYAKGL